MPHSGSLHPNIHLSMSKIQKITPYLWYDDQAKAAAEFYCSLFEHSQILSASKMIVEFELEGLKFVALNGGPKFKFTEATSFMGALRRSAGSR